MIPTIEHDSACRVEDGKLPKQYVWHMLTVLSLISLQKSDLECGTCEPTMCQCRPGHLERQR